jgi:hypothetical protein
LAVFEARCKAQAALVAAGEFDLHDAVDALQAAAVATGLVAAIGQDEVQRIMARAFGPSAWDAPSWRKPAAWYHEQRGERALIAEPQCRRGPDAPKSTVDALMYSLRQRGVAAIAEPDTRRRISQLNETQLREASARLQRFDPKIARPWTAEDVIRLLELWEACRHA